QDVRGLTGDEDQRRLATLVDGAQVGLDHGHPPTFDYVNQEIARRVVGGGGEAPRVASAGRHGRLDDDLAVQRRQRISGGDEDGRDDGEARASQVGEVALVAVPAQDVGEVAHAPVERVGPGQELVAPARVVEGRAHDDHVEGVPVRARVVP